MSRFAGLSFRNIRSSWVLVKELLYLELLFVSQLRLKFL